MSQPTRILLSLLVGLAVGAMLASYAPARALTVADWVQPVGQAWLNGLQMTIVPLVVALLITGVAATAEAAQAGRLAGRAIALYVTVLFLSAVAAAILTPLFLQIWPLPQESAAALRSALAGAEQIGPVPPLGEFFAAIIPANIIKAAAENAFLSLIIFSLIFAFAITRVGEAARTLLIGFFAAVRDVMLVVINWVLWIGPVGVIVATLTSLGSVSLPGTVSYVSAVAPVASTIGAPVAPLGLLVAVETLPDIMRTVGNVTWDLASTAWLARGAGKVPLDEADALLKLDGV